MIFLVLFKMLLPWSCGITMKFEVRLVRYSPVAQPQDAKRENGAGHLKRAVVERGRTGLK